MKKLVKKLRQNDITEVKLYTSEYKAGNYCNNSLRCEDAGNNCTNSGTCT